jgi:nucleotide-binding universal stress UspA family protein
LLRDTLKRVVVMRRCLVVANQTLQAAELQDKLRERVGAGPCSYVVIVPDTKAAQYDPVAAGGVLPQPGMWWWATYYARPATDEEATAQARERLSVMLTGLAALGVPVEGDLGSSDPLEAIEKACADRQFDEIIVTTLPQHVSRWLRSDLAHQRSAGSGCRSPPSSPVTDRPSCSCRCRGHVLRISTSVGPAHPRPRPA